MTKRIFATAIAAAVIATSLPTAGAANALTIVPTLSLIHISIAAGAAMEQPYSALLGEFRRIDS